MLKKLRDRLPEIFGEKTRDSTTEGNYYIKLGVKDVGEHGDKEKLKIIGVILHGDFTLCHQWFHNSERIGKRLRLDLKHGDMYVMSEKAVGNGWDKRSLYALRYCAGVASYIC